MFKRYWWMFLVMVSLGSIAGLLVAAVKFRNSSNR